MRSQAEARLKQRYNKNLIKMKYLFLVAFIAMGVHLMAAPKPTTVKVRGIYKWMTPSGPYCEKNDRYVCVLQRYLGEEVAVFPLGIVSATATDRATGDEIPISSVVQRYLEDGTFVLEYTYGAEWVGPFAIKEGDWSL